MLVLYGSVGIYIYQEPTDSEFQNRESKVTLALALAPSEGELPSLIEHASVTVSNAAPSSTEEEERLYELSSRLEAELNAGKLDNAASIADDLLKQAECCKNTWNYGNVIHNAHVALGRFALFMGDVDSSKMHLLEAGKTPGSPQLDSFGPDRILATELLRQGQRDTVLKYLELCSSFWKESKTGQPAKVLEYWKNEIGNGSVLDLTAYVDL